jgi:hypothetical protein
MKKCCVSGEGTLSNFQNPKVPLPGRIYRTNAAGVAEQIVFASRWGNRPGGMPPQLIGRERDSRRQFDCSRKELSLVTRAQEGEFYLDEIEVQETHASIVNLTVKRRYLTEREVERLMDCARNPGFAGSA